MTNGDRLVTLFSVIIIGSLFIISRQGREMTKSSNETNKEI